MQNPASILDSGTRVRAAQERCGGSVTGDSGTRGAGERGLAASGEPAEVPTVPGLRPGLASRGATASAWRSLSGHWRWLLAAWVILAGGVAGISLAPGGGGASVTHEVEVRARQFAYEPHRVVVDQGDRIRLRLASEDVVHGLFLEGQELDLVAFPGRLDFGVRSTVGGVGYSSTNEVTFRADRWGKFRYRCSTTCGPLHPFMLGELIVRPNYLFWAAAGMLTAGLPTALLLMWTARRGVSGTRPSAWRFDLLARIPLLRWYVGQRWFQLGFVVPALFFTTLLLVAGFWGSPIGNRNIIITFVWILWWFVLKTFLLPLGSRSWCAACPIPFVGDWFQRRSLVGVRENSRRMWAGFRHWPRQLSNLWLQNVLFLLLCTFSAVLVTQPFLTALALAGLLLTATVVACWYQGRAFCRYLCPVSGFLSVYAMASVMEVRARDPQRCAECRTKNCRLGSSTGWGCPWMQVPGRMERNNHCGMCMECVKACPNQNMTVRLRPFCADVRLEGYDEVWTAFIMMTLAIVYTVTMLGPWGAVKEWANIGEVGNWPGFLGYVAVIWSTALLWLPLAWYGIAALGRALSGSPDVPTRVLFLRYAYMLVPLGLCAWIAFGFPLIVVNGTHIIATVSDPLGRGWDLIGMTHIPWTPFYPEYLAFIQVPLVLLGLGFALRRGFGVGMELYGDARRACRSLIPSAVAVSGLALVFLVLFAG